MTHFLGGGRIEDEQKLARNGNRAARAAGMPVALSFTVETDGRLPTGPTLREAIDETDAATDGYPAYYMINCAHPTHFGPVLEPGAAWTERIRGVRANSSSKSHAELNDSPTLDEGNPAELGRQYRELVTRHPHFRVLGGCCGTPAAPAFTSANDSAPSPDALI